jgi:hypothetical protein
MTTEDTGEPPSSQPSDPLGGEDCREIERVDPGDGVVRVRLASGVELEWDEEL